MPDNPPAKLSDAIIEGSKDSEQAIGSYFYIPEIKSGNGGAAPTAGTASTSAMPGIQIAPKSSMKWVPKATLKKLSDKLEYVKAGNGGTGVYQYYDETYVHWFGLKKWYGVGDPDDLKGIDLRISLEHEPIWAGNVHTLWQAENAGGYLPLLHKWLIPPHNQLKFNLYFTTSVFVGAVVELTFELSITTAKTMG